MLFCISDPSLGGQFANLADIGSDAVRRWVNTTPSPTPSTPTTPPNTATKVSGKNHLNNNTIDLVAQSFWNRKKDDMPMLLQQPPSQLLLTGHETTADQPLDFTMSKFKTSTKNTANTVASQLKQLNSLTAQQQKMLLQQHNNGAYYGSRNNNKSFTRGSSPSSSSEEEGVGPPLPSSSPESPGPLRGDGKFMLPHITDFWILLLLRFYLYCQ